MLGKPYEQQPGRQHGKGTGHIVETVQEKLTDFNTPHKQEKLLQQLGDYINQDKFEGKLSNLKIYLTRKQAKHKGKTWEEIYGVKWSQDMRKARRESVCQSV